MNIREYISSGVVESYVLGLASEPERREFEAACAQYPEIAEARDAFERAMEAQMLQGALAPPAYIKQQIAEKLSDPGTLGEPLTLRGDEPSILKRSMWKWLAAACLILLAGTVIWSIKTAKENKALEAENRELQKEVLQSAARLDSFMQDARVLQRPGIKMAAMKGEDPAMFATVFWDTTTTNRDVYLLVNNLPAPASDKQYQLWALLNGQPIDLGMIEPRQERLLVRMKNVQNAQAFAITLEPKGGSSTPTSAPVLASKL